MDCQRDRADCVSKGIEHQGKLYVVATPIGNLDDITIRAKRVLSNVSYIAAEDTRHTSTLLRHLDINTPTRAYHDHNEVSASEKILVDLEGGYDVALVSDAGTPQVSDPGYRLVKLALDRGVVVVPIPGASALSATLSVSGVANHRFLFEGFLPTRKLQRRNLLNQLAREPRSIVLYEAPHRVAASLADMWAVFGGDRQLTIARELTKIHEQVYVGSIQSAVNAVATGEIPCRGEFVIMVEGLGDSPVLANLDSETVMRELLRELPASKAADVAARLTGESRKSLHQVAVSLKDH